jgi:hypothetical protein
MSANGGGANHEADLAGAYRPGKGQTNVNQGRQ